MTWLTPTNLIWIFGHLLLLFIGIVFLNADQFLGVTKQIAEGVGTGIIATGVAGEVLFLYVAFSDATRSRLELFTQAGLLKIFQHRSVRMREEYDVRLANAKELDVLGFGQSSFRQDYSDQFQRLSTQATVRIILIDPDFPTRQVSLADLRDKEESNRAGQIRNDVEEFLNVTRGLRQLDRKQFRVRLLHALPSISLFRIDDAIFWGPYFVGQQSRNTPTLLVQRGGFLFDQLKQHFEQIWTSEEYSSTVQY